MPPGLERCSVWQRVQNSQVVRREMHTSIRYVGMAQNVQDKLVADKYIIKVALTCGSETDCGIKKVCCVPPREES